MAVGNNLLTTLFKQKEVDERTKELNNLTLQLQEKYRNTFLQSDIDNLLKTIERRENRFFKIFGLTEGTPQEKLEILQDRIDKCKSQVFSLSGSALYEKVIGVLVEENYAEQKKFSEDFRKYLKTEDSIQKALASSNVQEELNKAILEILNEMPRDYVISEKKNSGRKLYSKKGHYGRTLEEVFVSKFTEAQYEAAKKYVEQKKMQLSVEKEVQDNVGILSTDTTWDIITNGLTSKQAKKLYPSFNDPTLIKIWCEIKKFILNLAPNADKNKLSLIIDYFQETDPYAIFVGKSYNEITGLLGEIQTAYYISVLTNTPFNQSNEWTGLKWLGNTLVDGKKSSTDLILNRIGIQVKNTTKDLEDNEAMSDISFTSLKVDEFLKRLEITGEDAVIIKSIYGTSSFNVSYQYDNEKGYYSSVNDKFKPTRDELNKLVAGMEQIFSYFSATLLHICFKKNIQNQPGNTAFFLGGDKIVLASAILASVFERIEKVTATGLKVKASIGEEGDNIITYLNNNKRKTEILQNTLNNITLTSSFNFRTLF